MRRENPSKTRQATGPKNRPLTLDDLPPADTKRWVIYRKAKVVAAVRDGLIGRSEVCQRYRMSPEEFLSWERLIDRHGVRGLRTTRLQEYRHPIPATDTETTSSGPWPKKRSTGLTKQRLEPEGEPAPGEAPGLRSTRSGAVATRCATRNQPDHVRPKSLSRFHDKICSSEPEE